MKGYFRYYKRNEKGAVAFTGWYEDTPGNRKAWEKTAEVQNLKIQVVRVHHFFDLFTTPLFSKLLRDIMENKDA